MNDKMGMDTMLASEVAAWEEMARVGVLRLALALPSDAYSRELKRRAQRFRGTV